MAGLTIPAAGVPANASVAQWRALATPGETGVLMAQDGRPLAVVVPAALADVSTTAAPTTAITAVSTRIGEGAWANAGAGALDLAELLARVGGPGIVLVGGEGDAPPGPVGWVTREALAQAAGVAPRGSEMTVPTLDEHEAAALFRAGERVQLTDPRGRLHTITLVPGKTFHTHRGSFEHDQLIGHPQGSVIRSTADVEYLALRPLLADYVLSMPRGAAVVYPKDASQIVHMGDIHPGARVLEAGVGSGALTMSLLRAVGEGGLLWSVERRDDFATIAKSNVEAFFGAPHPAWQVTVGDLVEVLAGPRPPGAPTRVDRVVLDMLAPWECLDAAEQILLPGGVLIVYVATATQLSKVVETARESGRWTEPSAWESMVRGWHLEGLAVRPEHRMIGHTGFLVTARRMADGVKTPLRRRRPAPGAYPVPESVTGGESVGQVDDADETENVTKPEQTGSS